MPWNDLNETEIVCILIRELIKLTKMKEKRIERTKTPKYRGIKQTTIQQMKRHIHAFNTRMSFLHMSKLSIIELLNNCHPQDRTWYAQKLFKERRISKTQLSMYTSKINTLTIDDDDEQETIAGSEGSNRFDEVGDFFPEG